MSDTQKEASTFLFNQPLAEGVPKSHADLPMEEPGLVDCHKTVITQ